MYPVTLEYNEKMLTQERRIYGKVQIDYTDPFLDQSVNMESSENANVSYPKQTADNIQEPIGKIASLDGSWVLDGSYTLAPYLEAAEIHQMGWWGKQLSRADGSFIASYPTLTATFFSRPIHSLKVVGDSAREEWPVDFTIRLYNEQGIMLHEEIAIGNSSITWYKILDYAITQVTKMELIIEKWSHAGRQCKIVEFFTSIQETYEGDDIFYINLLEEMEVNQGSLPIGTVSYNELDIRLYNKNRKFDAGNTDSPLYGMLKLNRKIKAWLGIEKSDLTKEFVPLGTFWSGDWNAPEGDMYVTTSGWDRLKFLSETEYSTGSVRQNVTLYDLALDVLQDAGLADNEYWIDEELKDYIIPCLYIESQSHRGVLRHIAEACLGHIYCDRYGIIRVEGTKEISELYDITSSENANVSYPSQVVDKIEMPDRLYASLDGSWVLDGSYSLAPETEGCQFGWWGSQLSDDLGTFTEPYPTLTLNFLGKAIEGIKVIGDSLREEYPINFNIKVYDSSNNILSHQIIEGNTDISKFISIPENPTNVTKLELVITKWSHPGRQAKIVEFKDMPYKLEITPDDYYIKNNPAKYSEVANVVEVTTQPLQPDVLQEVYRSENLENINAGQTKSLTVFYNNSPCINAVATIEGTGAITDITYYPWGAYLKVTSYEEGSFVIVVNANPLIIKNSKKIVSKDDNSIIENGLKRFVLPDNPLIQTESRALEIANTLLNNFKNPRRNLELDWRGNPALLLGNIVSVTDNKERNDYKVFRQELEYSGSLRAKLSGRRM